MRERCGSAGTARPYARGWQGLEPHFVKMRDAARQVIQVREADRPEAAVVREGLAIILDNEAEYLRRMDRVVGLLRA